MKRSMIVLPDTDINGKAHKALCMKKTTKGQVDTIECTGNLMRKQYHKDT